MRRLTSFLTTFLLAAVIMPIAVIAFFETSKLLGFRKIPVNVAGTGSMYPSLFWTKAEGGPDDETKMTVEEFRTTPMMYHRFPGIRIGNNTYLRRSISRGDMVAFINSGTRAILEKDGKDVNDGFIKRVVAVPGDVLELRDGYVYLNGKLMDEPYIYRPRSTYGQEFLTDCRKLTLPAHKYFVMGDNRKASSDSRGELGLVDDADFSFFLPLSEQKVYQSLWRDTSKDAELTGTPTLSSAEFVSLLNKSRQQQKIGILKESKTLSASAVVTGNHYLSGDKNYPLDKSLKAGGYENIVAGEFVTPGHFTAEELLQNLLYFPNTAKQVLDGRYQDIGIAAVNKEVDGCPTQVIVGHLGGYIPPVYEKATLESWEKLQANLDQAIPTWEKARGYQGIDQVKLEQLLTILYRRVDLAREIVATMRDNKWLTDGQKARIEADSSDADQAEKLIKEFNK